MSLSEAFTPRRSGDVLGAGLSVMCLLHCLTAPVLVSVLPLVGLATTEWLHGVFALVAAGMARMHIGRFLWWNLLATLPKTAGFAVLGWVLGDAYVLIGDWLAVISGAGLAVLLAAGGLWHVWRRRVSA